MKKILFVSTCYPNKEYPQYCVFLEQQAKALVDLGNIVDVLVPTSSETFKSVLHSSKFNNHIVYYINYRTLRCNILLNITTKSFYSLLHELLQENRYDVVSVHLAPDWILNDLIRLGKKLSIKIIQHYHGFNVWANYYSSHPFIEKVYAYKRKKILEKADAIIGVSDKVCNIIRSRLKNKNIFTVFNGVDIEKFKPVEKCDSDVFKIICVANLIPTKGQKYLIEAIAKLIDKIENKKIILDLIGRGTDENFLRSEVKRFNLEESVKFHGYIAYDNVAKLIANSDVFVLPSFFDACACVCLEAMACKVPVISCKNQGIAEIIIDGENGLLIKEKNTDSIVEKLLLLIENEGLRKSIGRQGYLTIIQNLTWNNSATKLKKVYDDILGLKFL